MSFKENDEYYETLCETAVEMGIDPTQYKDIDELRTAISNRETPDDWAYDEARDNELVHG